MEKTTKYNIVLGFAAIYLIWGSTYLAIRLGVATIPAFMLAAVRFLISGMLFYGWGKLVRAPSPILKEWFYAGLVGLLMVVGGAGFVTWAEEMVPSGLTALLIAMVPLWIVIINWLRRGGKRPKIIVVVGIFLGFVGMIALINPTNIGSLNEIDLFGALLLILATLSWAIGSILSRYAELPKSKIVSIGIQMFVGGIVLFILSFVRGENLNFEIADVTLESIISLLYLITFGSIGYASYIWLMKVSTPAKVATYAYVNPIIALFLGYLIADETISTWTITCSVFILISVIIIVTSKEDERENER